MTFDAVVVGAGILGCSTAWHLTSMGLNVAVIEREPSIGHGSTRRSTAIIRQRYSVPAAMALAREGLKTWEQWGRLVPAASDGERACLRPVGVLFLLPAGEPSTPELVASMRAVGIQAEHLSRDDMATTFPALAFAPQETVEGLYEPEGGYVDDPERATRDAARVAAAGGATFQLATRVVEVLTEWRRGGLEVRGVRTHRGETLEARVVVNCAGPHSGSLNVLARTPLPLATVPLRQVVVDGTAPALTSAPGPLPVVADLLNGVYLRPDPDRVRIGAVWPQDETEFLNDPDLADQEVDRSIVESRVAAARRRVPALQVVEPHGLVGVYDVTVQDWYPIVDRTETRGFFVAIGTSGAWFKAGPVIGRLMAEMIRASLDGRDTDREPLEVVLPITQYRFPMTLLSRLRRPVPLRFGGGVLG